MLLIRDSVILEMPENNVQESVGNASTTFGFSKIWDWEESRISHYICGFGQGVFILRIEKQMKS